MKIPITYLGKPYSDTEPAKAERKRIGKELWRWFYGKNPEPIECVIERITRVKDPNK